MQMKWRFYVTKENDALCTKINLEIIGKNSKVMSVGDVRQTDARHV